MARWRQIDLGKDLDPIHFVGLNVSFRAESCFDGGCRSLIACEVARVNIEAADRASKTQFDNAPVYLKVKLSAIATLVYPDITSHSWDCDVVTPNHPSMRRYLQR